MPNDTRNQKVVFYEKRGKLLALFFLLFEETDAEHGLGMNRIIECLQQTGEKGLSRKTIYNDIALLNEALSDHGYEIQKEVVDTRTVYKMVSRPFEVTDVKILVDAVSVAKFISKSRRERLLKKLGSLVSIFEEKQLNRNILLPTVNRPDNKFTFGVIDQLFTAIQTDKQVKFKYYRFGVYGRQYIGKNEDKSLTVSPYALYWEEENYYLLAYDAEIGGLKNFRVDKIERIEILKDARLGNEYKDTRRLNAELDGNFSMYHGEPCRVTLHCIPRLSNVIYDRFGEDIQIYPEEDHSFRVTVKVQLSNTFYGWLFGLGSGVQILDPPEAVIGYQKLLNEHLEHYK